MRVGFAKTIALLALLSLVSPPLASARDRSSGKGKEEAEKKTYDPKIAKRINEALDAMQAQRFDEARAALDRISLRRAKPFEIGRVEQIYATIDQSQEKYASAREHLKLALDSGGLEERDASAVRFQVARLLLVEDKWAEGVAALEDWFARESEPNSAAYYTLAVAYYQIQDMDKAVVAAQKAVDLGGDKPQASWLQLLLALRARRQEYALAYPILLRLIELQPDQKTHWVQASSAALAGDDYENAAALLQIARTGDLLTDAKEIRSLAGLLINRGIPFRAAEILQQAIDEKRLPADPETYELIGNCWIAAREYEKAVQPLTQAGDLSQTGEPYIRLAEVYVQQENWPGAADALRRGVGKGNLKRLGYTQLLMGMALFNQKNLPEARAWFERAAASPDQKAQAEAWLAHIEKAMAAAGA